MFDINFGVTLLLLGYRVEIRHVGKFCELGRARRDVQRYTNIPLIALNILICLG